MEKAPVWQLILESLEQVNATQEKIGPYGMK